MPISIDLFRRLPPTHCSGFILFITLLVLSSGPTYAEWVRVDETDTVTKYIDPETIRHKGHIVKIWELHDQKTVQTATGESYLSTKALDEYDCAEEQTRILAMYLYAGQMGSGKLLLSDTNPSKWNPVMPGSVGQAVWKVACGKP